MKKFRHYKSIWEKLTRYWVCVYAIRIKCNCSLLFSKNPRIVSRLYKQWPNKIFFPCLALYLKAHGEHSAEREASTLAATAASCSLQALKLKQAALSNACGRCVCILHYALPAGRPQGSVSSCDGLNKLHVERVEPSIPQTSLEQRTHLRLLASRLSSTSSKRTCPLARNNHNH